MIPWTPRPVYNLEDLNEKLIDGQFYQEELTPVSVSKQTLFKIDKIIATRVRRGIKEHKVRWLGYGPDYDSWIKASTIKKIWNAKIGVNRDDFYVTLFSNASTDIFTLNSQGKFTNHLALPVALGSSSDWALPDLV